MSDLTPLMAQYREIKNNYPDCILLFRVGDFYETFYEDAVEISSILNIALTTRDKKRDNPVPLAGVPFHAAENYITRLLAAGKKVAVCEQTEDPAKAKGLVKREVVEVLTPGTALTPQLLRKKENNFCMAIYVEGPMCAAAIVDVSTGELLYGQERMASLHDLLQGTRVAELLANVSRRGEWFAALLETLGQPFLVEGEEECFAEERSEEALSTQFEAAPEDALDALSPLERRAVGALLFHCQKLRGGALPQLVRLQPLAQVRTLSMDDETIGNLELFEPLRGGERKATLMAVLDHTLTPMGSRELRRWLEKPLADPAPIQRRQDGVAEIFSSSSMQEELVRALKNISDIRRLSARVAARKAIPREFHALRESLKKLPKLLAVLSRARSDLLRDLSSCIADHQELEETIGRAIVPDPPAHLREGGVIRKGYSPELDELLRSNEEAKQWIAGLERKERQRTGIGSLKVGYNKIFGYYIEVSKIHSGSVPADYVTKQTLVNSQRYFTSELKEKEELIMAGEERRIQCEQKLYDELCQRVVEELPLLHTSADAVGRIDALLSLALAARKYSYKRPVVDDSLVLEIDAGRHPVLEHYTSDPFVPNGIRLDPATRQFALITGPNMSGKSTFLRQVALVTILAQIGSFVPASRARIGVVDRIFTRVGATDRLSRGESTFLVEMKETAHILEGMTDRSLILLDEVGRGTSTFDGLSIAWAVTEYILEGVKARPKTLFATHFHELTQLRSTYPRLFNLKITIKEWEGGIIFLRKIVPGVSERSYGIHAGRVAGLPRPVIKRAEEILRSLELRRELLHRGVDISAIEKGQYDLFAQSIAGQENSSLLSDNTIKTIIDQLKSFEIDKISPLQAFDLLKRLKELLPE